jgi:hypothetical protein
LFFTEPCNGGSPVSNEVRSALTESGPASNTGKMEKFHESYKNEEPKSPQVGRNDNEEVGSGSTIKFKGKSSIGGKGKSLAKKKSHATDIQNSDRSTGPPKEEKPELSGSARAAISRETNRDKNIHGHSSTDTFWLTSDNSRSNCPSQLPITQQGNCPSQLPDIEDPQLHLCLTSDNSRSNCPSQLPDSEDPQLHLCPTSDNSRSNCPSQSPDIKDPQLHLCPTSDNSRSNCPSQLPDSEDPQLHLCPTSDNSRSNCPSQLPDIEDPQLHFWTNDCLQVDLEEQQVLLESLRKADELGEHQDVEGREDDEEAEDGDHSEAESELELGLSVRARSALNEEAEDGDHSDVESELEVELSASARSALTEETRSQKKNACGSNPRGSCSSKASATVRQTMLGITLLINSKNEKYFCPLQLSVAADYSITCLLGFMSVCSLLL